MQQREVKLKTCAAEGCENQFKPFYSFDRYCSYMCTRNSNDPPTNQKSVSNKKRIRPVSVSRSRLNNIYTNLRREFLGQPDNRFCPVTCGKATEVHHKLGRRGFADDWAREKNIPLLIDVRFWLAVSSTGHHKIEADPEWALKMGYSMLRTVTRSGKFL